MNINKLKDQACPCCKAQIQGLVGNPKDVEEFEDKFLLCGECSGVLRVSKDFVIVAADVDFIVEHTLEISRAQRSLKQFQSIVRRLDKLEKENPGATRFLEQVMDSVL